MKKIFLRYAIGITFLVLAFNVISYSQTKSDKKVYDFRNVNWGMDPETVKNSESNKPILEKDGIILYDEKIAGLKAPLGYVFFSDKLVRANYLIRENHSNKNDYIADYTKLKKLLTQKYGTPAIDDEVWKNDLFKTKPQSWGTAISIGHLVYSAQWETNETIIDLILSGDNYEINFAIQYRSKVYKSLEEDAKSEESIDDL